MTRPAACPGGARVCQRMFTRLGCRERPPRFVVEFFPYANLVNTIRLRDDAAYVRLSDLLCGAPVAVLEAAAAVLIARLYRRALPRELAAVYSDFSLDARTQRRLRRMRGARAQRAPAASHTAHHNLSALFGRLNRRYFAARLPRPHLAWSTRPWRSQLGCFDPALSQILINSRLNDPRVPRYAVEYVLYHEMLHVKHPLRRASCGLQAHSAAFRREEKLFREYSRARRFLERLR